MFHVTLVGMKGVLNRIIGSFHAAHFSDQTNTYYSNTKREAAWSFIVPFLSLLYVTYISGRLQWCPASKYPDFGLCYTGLTIASLLIALPKFIIYFALVWLLCRLLKTPTDNFCAFIAANNWFYVVYLLLFGLFSLIIKNNHDGTILLMATQFYVCLVVMCLGQKILGLQQEGSWLVPAAFVYSFVIVKLLTTKSGIFFVF